MDLELTDINCDILIYNTIRRCVLYNFTRPVYKGLKFGDENFNPVGSSEHEMAHLKNAVFLNISFYQ
jgi:hypothetical protein